MNRAARGVDVPPIEVAVEALTDELRRDVRGSVRDIQNTIRAEIPLDADGVVFREQVARAVQQVEDRVSADIPVEPDELAAFARKVRSEVADIARVVQAKVPVEPDVDGRGWGAQLRAQLYARVRAASAGLSAKIGVEIDKDRLLSAAGSMAKLTAVTAGLITAGAGAASALSALGPVLAVLVGLVGQLAGGLVVLPGLLAGVVGMVAAVKIGLSGVGDALSNAFDPEKVEAFNEAMSRLAPAAQETVRAIQALGPAWDGLRLDVQQQLFAGVGERISAISEDYLPMLQRELAGTAAGFNAGATAVLDYLNTASAMDAVEGILGNTAEAARNLGTAFQPAVEGLLLMAGVGSAQLPILANEIAFLSDSFRDWVINIGIGQGVLQAWIDGAKTAFSQLGQILGNLGTVFGAMWEAAGASGAGALTSFVALTDQLAAFVQTAEGMSLLTGIFAGISTAAGVFRGILGELLPALAPIAEQLPVMFENAGPGLIALAAGIGSILRAAAPLVPVIGTLVSAIGSGLGTVLQMVAPLVSLLASTLGFLGPVLGPVVAGLTGFAATLATMVGVILAVSKVISVLKTAWMLLNVAFAVSPIGFVIALIVGLVAALIYCWQNFEGFRNVVTGAWEAILSAGQAALDWIMGLPAMIGSALAAAGSWFAGLGTAALDALTAVGTWLSQLPGMVLGWLTGLGATVAAGATAAWAWLWQTAIAAGQQVLAFLAALPGMIAFGLGYLAGLVYTAALAAWNFLWNTLPGVIAQVGAWLLTLPGQVMGWLAMLGSFVLTAATAAWNFLVSATVAGINAALAWVAALPGRVMGFLAGLAGTVSAGASAAWRWLLTTVVTFGSQALAWIGSLPGRVGGFLAALPGVVMGAASRAWSGFLSATTSLASAALGFIGSLPGRIMGFFAAAGSWLVSAGRAIIQGLWNGLKSMAQGVLNYISDLAGRVAAGFKSAIGIASPSKVFIGFGKNIGEGLIVGLERIAPQVASAARQLAERTRKAATDPMRNAAREILDHLRAGGSMFEDFSFRGNSDLVRRFNDQLADAFERSGISDPAQFLEQYLRDTQQDLIAAARRAADAARGQAEINRGATPPSLVRDALARTDAAGSDREVTTRPRVDDAAQAEQVASAVGAAVHGALDKARLEVSGSGLARVVSRGDRENSRR